MMTFETMDRLLKLGNEVFVLYGFYLKTYHIQNVNPIYCLGNFVAKGLGWSKNTVTKYRRILAENNFISIKVARNKKGHFTGEYVMLRFTLNQPFPSKLGNGNKLGITRHEDGSFTFSAICMWCQINDFMYNRFPISPFTVNLGSNTILTNNINTKKQLKPQTKKKVFSEDSLEIKISKYLYDRILLFNKQHKKPNFQQWALHVDKILRIDNRQKKDIKRVIDFATGDDFWQGNILSTSKLRSQFDQLLIKTNAVQIKMVNAQKEQEDANPYKNLKNFSEINNDQQIT